MAHPTPADAHSLPQRASYRRIVMRVLSFTTLMVMLLFAASYLPASPRLTSFLFALQDKQKALAACDSPKIVLVGGSNVAFGTDSEFLQDRTGLPVTNFGLNAAIPLKYQLLDVESDLQAGDVLIVSAEYSAFQSATFGNPSMAAILVDIDPLGWRHLSLTERVSMTNAIAIYTARKSIECFEAIANRAIGRKVIESGLETYRRSAFNSYGDVTVHWREPGTRPEPYEHVAADQFDKSVWNESVACLKRLRQNQVRVLMVPPPLHAETFDRQVEFIERVSREVARSGFAYTLEPAKMRLGDDYFFDTPYHLSRRGIDIRMNALIGILSTNPTLNGPAS